VPLALVLREKVRGHRFFRLVILVPLVVPSLIGALGLLVFWGPRGWINLFLTQFVPGVQRPLAVNYTLGGLVLFYVWLYFPYTCVTTLAALEGLDRSIEEASEVAGANRWQVLRHVVLPLIKPGILAGSVLTFMAAFGAFSVPLIAGGNYRPLAVEIYKQISVPIPARWSAASAIAVVMGTCQVAFLALYMRFVRRAGARP
jgi:ABC-type Fe3+ transport system permease subunit